MSDNQWGRPIPGRGWMPGSYAEEFFYRQTKVGNATSFSFWSRGSNPGNKGKRHGIFGLFAGRGDKQREGFGPLNNAMAEAQDDQFNRQRLREDFGLWQGYGPAPPPRHQSMEELWGEVPPPGWRPGPL